MKKFIRETTRMYRLTELALKDSKTHAHQTLSAISITHPNKSSRATKKGQTTRANSRLSTQVSSSPTSKTTIFPSTTPPLNRTLTKWEDSLVINSPYLLNLQNTLRLTIDLHFSRRQSQCLKLWWISNNLFKGSCKKRGISNQYRLKKQQLYLETRYYVIHIL